jgi:thiol-disulfide isomerase/thioredoxin
VQRSRLHLVLTVVAIAAGAAGYWLASRQEPALPPPEVAPAATPEVRPVFTLLDADGNRRSSSEFEGRAVLFNFWATWCAPCRREIPLLNALQAEYADRGLQVVGIAVDTAENVAAYQAELPLRYPSLHGELDAIEVGRRFGLDLYGLPVSVFTDRQGRILGSHVGELDRDQAEGYLAKMLAPVSSATH